MRGFVRRKYPQLHCAQVAEQVGEIPYQGDEEAFTISTWASGSLQSDSHVDTLPVWLGKSHHEVRSPCLLCRAGAEASSRPEPVNGSAGSAPRAKARPTESDEHEDCRAWLHRFYSVNVPDKLPYVDVILNRYRGRYDDLKGQLQAKYGAAPASEAEASSASSSSSDDEEDNEEQDSGDLWSRNFSREWLIAFYQRYQPDKLVHVDKVLKQFSGREDTLQQMLRAKYANSAVAEKRKAEAPTVEAEEEPKKRKVEQPPIEIPTTFVTDQEPSGEDQSTSANSLCYVLRLRHAPYPVVWIVDCRSVEHLDALIATFPAPMDGTPHCEPHKPGLMVHFSSPRVRRHVRYARWMASHAIAGTEQLVFDARHLESVCNGAFSLAFQASAKHSLTHPRAAFAPEAPLWTHLEPFLRDDNTSIAKQQQIRLSSVLGSTSSHNTAHLAQRKLRFHLIDAQRSGFNFEQTGWVRRPSKETDEDAKEEEEEEGDAKTPPSVVQAPLQIVSKENAHSLIVLGTGSAAPSKLRGSTAMYMELKRSPSEHESILVDCGEGTYGQLWRQFGDSTAAKIGALRCIWISHNHADHQCGLVRVLQEFVNFHQAATNASRGASLVVIAPQSVLTYVDSWMPHLAIDNKRGSVEIRLVTCQAFNRSDHPLRVQLLGGAIQSLQSVPVWHCHDAFGLVLVLVGGKKLVYSGDTRPCHQLVSAGRDAALLIHEATFDDSMEEDAERKRHSTVGQALDVGRRMRAQQIILTHFSQRYPSLPPTTTTATATAEEHGGQTPVFCAFDGFMHRLAM